MATWISAESKEKGLQIPCRGYSWQWHGAFDIIYSLEIKCG